MKNRNTYWRLVFAVLGIFITGLLAVSLALPLSASAATPTPTPAPLQGDLNNDGRIDCADLILLQICLNTQSASCDIDGNKKSNVNDRILLFNIILGKVIPAGGGGGGGGSNPTPTPQPNIVYFNNSSYAKTYGPGAAGQNFTARVQIDNTNYLYNGTFTVNYNSSLLQLNNVSNGNFSGKDIPMVNGTDWTNAAGLLTVMPNLSAHINMSSNTSDGISGSGYLCDIQFQTIGAGTSPLTINGTLNQRQTGNFSVISGTRWTNSSVVITQWYNLNISTAAHGNVTAPGTGNFSYANNTLVTITANATDSCWQFYRWEGDTGAITNVSAASTTIRMNGSHTISANFSIKTFALTVTANNSGGNPTPAGTGTYNCGDLVNISANTNPCYTFAGWTPTAGVDNPNAENTTVLMNATRSLTARYTVKRVTLTTGSSTGGNVTAPGEAGSPYTYNCSQVVTITAMPDLCRSFVNWSGTGVIAGKVDDINSSTTTITMDDNYSVYATFIVSNYPTLTLSADPTEGGTQTGDGTFECGNNSPIQANPNPCYTFVNWTPSTGIANASAASTTVLMNTSRSLVAHYAIRTFSLSVNASPTAGGSPTGAGTYNCSSNATISANNNSCYNFVNWSSTGNITVANPNAATTNVTMNGVGTVTAHYTIKQYTLTTNVSPAEAVSAGCTVSGAATYNCGANATVQANEAGRYIFDHWSDGLSGSTNPANVTMNGNTNVTANFVPIPMVYFETLGTQSVGTPFTIKVLIDDIANLSVGGFDVQFNNSILSYQSTNSTSIIGTKTGEVDTSIIGTGLLRVAVDYSEEGASGVSGSGYMCAISFSPLAEGTSTFNFVGDLNLLDYDSNNLLAYWENGSVTASSVLYNLTTNVLGSGAEAAGCNITTNTSNPHAGGSIVQVTANTVSGWAFVNWSGDLSGSTSPTTIIMDSNKTVNATFAPVATYNLTTNVLGSGAEAAGCNITTNTSNPHNSGSIVLVTANPASGWAFVNWSGDLSGSTSPTTITMDSAKTVNATFAQITYNLTTNVLGSGAEAAGCNITTNTSNPHNSGSIVLVTANPASGWTFVNWSGDLSGSTSPTTVTMNSNKTVNATFARITYTLNITASSGGTVTDPGLGLHTYNISEVVNINASQNFCNRFVNWSGDTGDISNPNAQFTNITMNGNYTIQANFATITYNLTTSNSTGGTVTAPGIGTYTRNCSQNVTITATNYSCYRFDRWTGDTGQIADVNASTTNITMYGNYSITANFSLITYTLTVNNDGNGGTTPSGSSTRNCSEVVAISATPSGGYTFVNWTGDTDSIDNVSAASANITMNGTKTIQANFINGSDPTPDAITDLAIMSEDLGGIEWDSIRLTWTSPGNTAVDSYEIRYSSSAINDGNWASATTASTTFASIKGAGVTQNCTVTGLTEGQTYYFAAKSTKGSKTSLISDDSPSATAQQPAHDTGDWWLYKEYYNDEGQKGDSNKAYFITNVIQTGNTTKVWVDASDSGTGTDSGPCAVVNKWLDERTTKNGGWGRMRVVWAPVVTSAENSMHDAKIWITDDDWTQWIRIVSLPESFTVGGLGTFPTNTSYWNGSHTARTAWSGAQSNGYPYSNTKTFGWYEYIHADTTSAPSVLSHRHFYKDYSWVTSAWVSSYDVSTASSDADAHGVGTYGVWPITINDTWNSSDAIAPPNDVDPILIWYSPAVHNYVRALDKIRYYGREDSAIFAYEVRDFLKSSPTVSWTSSYVNVSITVTNILDVTSNFSLLCTLANMSAYVVDTGTLPNPATHPYINGKLIYPNLSTVGDSTVWGNPSDAIGSAVKYTGNIAPGDSATVNWNISGSFVSSKTYEVWCQGQNVSHTY